MGQELCTRSYGAGGLQENEIEETDMKELLHIEATVFFEISDSKMYGGQGTKGYAAQKIGGLKNPENITDDMVEGMASGMAKFMNVPREKIRIISKEEYDEQTDDDETYEDCEEDSDWIW